MVDKICNFLVEKMKKEMPEIDDEKAEIITYGLKIMIGEIPKIFIVFLVSVLLNIWKNTLLTFLIILPYRAFAGGVHLKTHLGCIIATTTMYCLPGVIAKYIDIGIYKYALILLVWIFAISMIKLYAPADTENVPILRKKDRRKRQILSYIIVSLLSIIAIFINTEISNLIIISIFIQTLTITRFIYKLTKNNYGYEVYNADIQTN